MPDALCGTNVKGTSCAKSVFYPGLEEELDVGDFEPDPEILNGLENARSVDEIAVLTRAPPTRAIYHRFPNLLFVEKPIARQGRCAETGAHGVGDRRARKA
jgi:predicted glycosyltransferase